MYNIKCTIHTNEANYTTTKYLSLDNFYYVMLQVSLIGTSEYYIGV